MCADPLAVRCMCIVLLLICKVRIVEHASKSESEREKESDRNGGMNEGQGYNNRYPLVSCRMLSRETNTQHLHIKKKTRES